MGLGPMRWASRASAASLLIAIAMGSLPIVHARQPDKEQDLLARIEREQNPVKKSKYTTRLAQLKLQEAAEAYGKGDFEHGQKLLDDYLKWVKSSWDLLRGSGRPADRKPQGFKELDIALREHARTFEDLKHRVPFTDRDPVIKAAGEVEKIRGEVLAALFPGGGVGAVGEGNKGKPGPKPQPHFRSG